MLAKISFYMKLVHFDKNKNSICKTLPSFYALVTNDRLEVIIFLYVFLYYLVDLWFFSFFPPSKLNIFFVWDSSLMFLRFTHAT